MDVKYPEANIGANPNTRNPPPLDPPMFWRIPPGLFKGVKRSTTGSQKTFPRKVRRPEYPIKQVSKRLCPRPDLLLKFNPYQPHGNFQFRVILQNSLNPFKELPHDPGKHATSGQLFARSDDE